MLSDPFWFVVVLVFAGVGAFSVGSMTAQALRTVWRLWKMAYASHGDSAVYWELRARALRHEGVAFMADIDERVQEFLVLKSIAEKRRRR